MFVSKCILGLTVCSLATAATQCYADAVEAVSSMVDRKSMPEAPPAPRYRKRVDNITKGKTDDASYSYLELNNGLGVFLISDSNLEKASASLCVGVGSYSDPVDVPGLAHFTEHMLFMGTEKYPEESGFRSFVNTNGGSYNGQTEGDNTTYYFSVPTDRFESVLDRFAQFFISPTFRQDCVEREISAVDAEYNGVIINEDAKVHQAIKKIFDQSHLFTRFSAGNAKTLNIPNIRERVVQFYKTHYSANIMKLVLKSNQSLASLEDLAINLFSDISNTNAKRAEVGSDLFGKKEAGNYIKIKRNTPANRLSVLFQLPSTLKLYRYRMSALLLRLLNSNCPGGINYELTARGLASQVDTNWYASNEYYNVVKFFVDLTEEGSKRIEDIVQTILALGRQLQGDIPEYIMEDLKNSLICQFDYEHKSDHVEMQLSQYMFNIRPEDLLSYGHIMEGVSQQKLHSYLKFINAENMIVVHASSSFDDSHMATDAWYDVKYSIGKLELSDAKPVMTKFEFIPPNHYIASNFDLVSKELAEPKLVPEMLLTKSGATLWYKRDDTFMLPKSHYRFMSRTGTEFGSYAERKVWVELFVHLLSQDLLPTIEKIASASLILYPMIILSGPHFEFRGFSDKLPVVLNDVANIIAAFKPNKDLFLTVQQLLYEQYSKGTRNPAYSHALECLGLILATPSIERADITIAIKEMTFDRFEELFVDFKNSVFDIEAMVLGNVTGTDAMEHVNSFISTALPGIKHGKVENVEKSLKLREREASVFTKTVSDTNYAVVKYMETGMKKSIHDLAMVALMTPSICHIPFNVLRTQQQAGYVVQMASADAADLVGVVVIVQSPSKNPITLDEMINKVIDENIAEAVRLISDTDFEGYKAAAIHPLKRRFMNLVEEADHFVSCISSRLYNFAESMEIIEEIEKITLDEFKAYVMEKLINNRKSVSVHAWPEDKFAEADYGKSTEVYNTREEFVKNHDIFKPTQ